MEERKQFQGVKPPKPELLHALEESRKKPPTEEELREQRISFAFGNALDSELITKDSVRVTSRKISLVK
jgi:hypothetical protein